MADDLALAMELADAADAITRGRYLAADLAVETKPDLTPVTEADRAVERAIRDRLRASRPGDSVLGEEYGSSGEGASGSSGEGASGTSGAGASGTSGGGASGTSGGGARRWIVDPIDGTKNYVRGIPVWATLLALEIDAELMLGVVSAPALGRRWWASRGSGAFVLESGASGPRALRVSGVREFGDAQLCYSDFDQWRSADALFDLGRRCWRTRGFGDFWNYMLVAEGAAEIACEPVVSLWDLAALQVIVEEAGGTFTDLGGVRTAAGGDAIASNGLVHEAALRIIGR